MGDADDDVLRKLDSVLLGVIAVTLVLSAGRVVLGVVMREGLSHELSFALAFALLSAAALAGELNYRRRARR